MKEAMHHGEAVMSFSWKRALGLILLPEFVRFHFNLAVYPRETDLFFRKLARGILKTAKEARKNGKEVRSGSIINKIFNPAFENCARYGAIS